MHIMTSTVHSILSLARNTDICQGINMDGCKNVLQQSASHE
ncbi:hypothetical protein Plhal304r1_c023g0079711 [Plasmopara halstedii]